MSKPTRKAATTPQAKPFVEMGSSGLTHWGGYIDNEFLRELKGPKGTKTFREMADNDDMVGAALLGLTALGQSASFSIEAADKTPEGEEARQFVAECLFEDMSQTWQDTLGDILTLFTFGYAPLEMVFKVRGGASTDPNVASSNFDDGKIGIRKLALRPQETIFRWVFDESGGIQALVQRDPTSMKEITIPIAKFLLFRTTTQKNNPEGRSLLRNAYRSWYFKKNIQTTEGIGIERDLAGYPVIQLGEDAPDLWNDKDPNAAILMRYLQDMVKGIRVDEQMGAVMPKWATLSLLTSGSRRSFDTNATITRYDQRIAMTMLADFLLLGHDAVGSKALSFSKIDVFTKALKGFLERICDVINRFLIPPLMKLNGVALGPYPKLAVGNLTQVDLAVLGPFLLQLSQAGMPLFPNAAIERAILDVAELPSGEDGGELNPAMTPEEERALAVAAAGAGAVLNPDPNAPVPPITKRAGGRHGRTRTL
jgi:hypothetical protein